MNLRLAFRSLWKNPVFAVVSIVVLALGIGANTAIFSVVNAVLLKPLPYQHPERIVDLRTLWPQSGHTGQISGPNFIDWRKQSDSFQAMSLYAGSPEDVFANKTPLRVNVTWTDPQFFKVFGVSPVMGRVFSGEDNKASAAPLAVISQQFFERVFHGDPSALGQTIKMEQHALTIIGVMPAGFDFVDRSQIWAFDPAFLQQWGSARTANNFYGVGLLKSNISLDQARAEATTIGLRLAAEYPNDDSKRSMAVTPLHDELVHRVRTTLYLLLAAVALVLLIACANVANLLLARVTMRRQEIAIRAALGASRKHVIQQLLLEAMALAVPAAAIGLLLGWWSAQLLGHFSPEMLAQAKTISLDWHVGVFTAGIALLCTALFGLAPAFQGSQVDVNSALHEGGSSRVMSSGMGRLRGSIVVAEIAMSMALLIGSAILIRSLLALSAVDPGYQAQGVSVMVLSYPASTPEDQKQAVQFYSNLLQQGAATPGVRAIAGTTALPNEWGSDGLFYIEGKPKPAPGDFQTQEAGFMVVSPGYFPILGIPLTKGREFGDQDQAQAQQTCIINEVFARRFFPGEDPIGHRLQTGYDLNQAYMTIVGVVADVRQVSLDQPPYPYIYMPYQQHPGPAAGMDILFRGSEDSAAALAREAHRLNPEIAVEFTPLKDVVDQAFAPSRFRSGLLTLFAALALVLAIAGLYGVMSYTVAQRKGEIGVRMALGAQPREVLRMILGQGLWLVLPGVVIGAVIAFAGGRVFTSLVYGVKASDPVTFVGIAVLLVVVALLAMYIPARRAADIDPMLALRNE
ncbi:MAG TPA: ABC transporter permease [Terriglobales bacterium]|nr:ABC transporter permease [Terriglobales bacterium]